MTHYSTYSTSLLKYQHRPITPPHPNRVGETIIGALLLLSPMFWLFIAELIK